MRARETSQAFPIEAKNQGNLIGLIEKIELMEKVSDES
jgi:hypothetical protein